MGELGRDGKTDERPKAVDKPTATDESYTVQIHTGTDWVDAAGQVRSPEAPQPNLDTVTFPTVTAQRVRVLATHRAGFGTGIKEFQVFDAVSCDTTVTGTHIGPLRVTSGLTCLADGSRVVGPVTVGPGAGPIANGASVIGRVTATGARTVQLLGGEVIGPVIIEGTFGRVAIAGARIVGPVRLSGNATGVTSIDVMANTITGPLACSANEPAPVDNGLPNSVIGPVTCQLD